MEDCCDDVCETQEKTESGTACPQCGAKGKAIKLNTVRYMVLGPLQSRVQQDYRFCPSPACPIVYFSKKSTFTKDQLSEKVTVKEPGTSTPVCYCFNYSRGDIEEEFKQTGRSDIREFISAQIKTENCFCEYTNPQGSCCLGNVNAVMKPLQKGGK